MIVTLYARPGCHLCDRARDAILALAEELGGIELREVDIESDDALLAAYLERIPVVEVDGEVVDELEIDPDELRPALAALHTVRR
ncbi:MAG: glutaredoxin family protein [Solirubrobacterales bacterium]